MLALWKEDGKNKRNVEERRSQDKGKLRRGRGEAAGWLVTCILNKIVKKSGVPKAKRKKKKRVQCHSLSLYSFFFYWATTSALFWSSFFSRQHAVSTRHFFKKKMSIQMSLNSLNRSKHCLLLGLSNEDYILRNSKNDAERFAIIIYFSQWIVFALQSFFFSSFLTKWVDNRRGGKQAIKK